MAKKYHLTNKAVEDLSDIWEYTLDAWSERQADAYYNMLIGACQKITENPQLFGTRYEEIAEGLRGYRANKISSSTASCPRMIFSSSESCTSAWT